MTASKAENPMASLEPKDSLHESSMASSKRIMKNYNPILDVEVSTQRIDRNQQDLKSSQASKKVTSFPMQDTEKHKTSIVEEKVDKGWKQHHIVQQDDSATKHKQISANLINMLMETDHPSEKENTLNKSISTKSLESRDDLATKLRQK